MLSFVKEKFKHSLKARFFLWCNLSSKKADLHFHACSFGEVKSIQKLATNFDTRLSVITQTGFDEGKKYCEKTSFLAFESLIPLWFKPCKMLVLVEAELWLMLVFVAKLRGAKTMLINARISEFSFYKYRRFAFLYRKIFSYIDEIWAQSEVDKMRLEALGAKNVRAFFNIKAALEPKINKAYTKPKARLILLASTHEGEEELLLRYLKLRQDEKLIVAPRHPERFEKVAGILQEYARKNSYQMQRLNEFKGEDLAEDFSGKILLIDSLNELVNFYAICDVVVLCGSFLKGIGGHNPIEVAHFNKAIISGVHIHNQKALFSLVEGVSFCENLQDLSKLIANSSQTKINTNPDLSPIISSIQRGIDERS